MDTYIMWNYDPPCGTLPQLWVSAERTDFSRAEAIALWRGSIDTKQRDELMGVNLHKNGKICRPHSPTDKNPNRVRENKRSYLEAHKQRPRDEATRSRLELVKDLRGVVKARIEALDRSKRGEAAAIFSLLLSWKASKFSAEG